MAAPFLAWSHSRLKTFNACPKQLYHTAILKRTDPGYVPYIEGKAQRDGKEIDQALSDRIGKGVPLPAKFAPYEPIAGMVLALPGAKFTQLQLGLDQTFTPCGYKDWDNCWVRVAYDLAVINDWHAYLWDWKNGKVWIDESQLRLYATIGFHVYPELEVIDTSFVWLAHGKTSDKTYRRRELPDLWETFLPDVERLQVSFKTNHWPATPSESACKWCSVNQAGKCPVAAVKYAGR